MKENNFWLHLICKKQKTYTIKFKLKRDVILHLLRISQFIQGMAQLCKLMKIEIK